MGQIFDHVKYCPLISLIKEKDSIKLLIYLKVWNRLKLETSVRIMTIKNHLKWSRNTHLYTTVTCCVIENKLMSLCTLSKLGFYLQEICEHEKIYLVCKQFTLCRTFRYYTWKIVKERTTDYDKYHGLGLTYL